MTLILRIFSLDRYCSQTEKKTLGKIFFSCIIYNNVIVLGNHRKGFGKVAEWLRTLNKQSQVSELESPGNK